MRCPARRHPRHLPAAAARGLELDISTRTQDTLLGDDWFRFLAGSRYQLVLAADVFVYVNDLKPILEGVAQLLTPDGLAAFTVETHAGDGIKLLPTLRFAYGETYMREAIAASELALLRLSAAAVRTEKGIPVQGLVVVAGAAAQNAGPDQA